MSQLQRGFYWVLYRGQSSPEVALWKDGEWYSTGCTTPVAFEWATIIAGPLVSPKERAAC